MAFYRNSRSHESRVRVGDQVLISKSMAKKFKVNREATVVEINQYIVVKLSNDTDVYLDARSITFLSRKGEMGNPYKPHVDAFLEKVQEENEKAISITLKGKQIKALRGLIFQANQDEESPLLLEVDKILHSALQRL